MICGIPKYSFAQVKGLCHAECEDASLYVCRGNVHFLGIADGQSGKKHSREGAEKALETLADYILEKDLSDLMSAKYLDSISYEMLQAVREGLEVLAHNYDTSVEEFSSTLLAVIYDTTSGKMATVHLGDGCILGVYRNGDDLKMISSPDNGSSGHSTWLTTSKNALFHLRVGFGDLQDYRRILLMSDGAKCLCRKERIQNKVKAQLSETSHESIIQYIVSTPCIDDATCIILDC